MICRQSKRSIGGGRWQACGLALAVSVLAAAADPVLLRGPYLQSAAATAVTVCWRTDHAGVGTVRYGLSPGELTWQASGVATTEHAVRLTGLAPATGHFYQLETAGVPLAGGGGRFTTAPVTGTAPPLRFWVIGDSGTGTVHQAAVRDGFAAVHAQRPAQFIVTLGDNAYYSGYDIEYQRYLFDAYRDMLRELPLWPCIGNHDTYNQNPATGEPFYLSTFRPPMVGECGGVASNTPRYHAWNHANVHFVCLDSMASDLTPTGPMARWLVADLAANTLPWVVAYFHHPPYTKGSHDSDTEAVLVWIRAYIVPILEAHGVDLVLSGHSHSYERTALLNGHHGHSSTFSAAHLVDGGDGRYGGGGPYVKPPGANRAHSGTVYVVAGSSGQVTWGPLNHPAALVSLLRLGSLVIDVADDRMDVAFLRESAGAGTPPQYDDSFTILKGPVNPPLPPGEPVALALGPDAALLHWPDNSGDEAGFRVELAAPGGAFTPWRTMPANARSCELGGLAPDAVYQVRVSAFNNRGDSAPAHGSFTLPQAPPPVGALARLRFAGFGTTTNAGAAADLADPDLDGAPNVLEWALGSAPADGGSRPVVTAARGAGGRLAVAFRRAALPEVEYLVEFSSNLLENDWLTGFTSSGGDNTAGEVVVTDPLATAPPARFGRVRVRLAAP